MVTETLERMYCISSRTKIILIQTICCSVKVHSCTLAVTCGDLLLCQWKFRSSNDEVVDYFNRVSLVKSEMFLKVM